MVKKNCQSLVSHRQLLGIIIIIYQFFNFVPFCLSGELSASQITHLAFWLFMYSAYSFFIVSFSGTRSSF